MRTSRPKTPVIYGPDERFELGGLKVLRRERQRRGDGDRRRRHGLRSAEGATTQLQAQGVDIRVVDLYSLQPIDAASLMRCAEETKGRLITVEDHYRAGGIGDAVASAVAEPRLYGAAAGGAEIPRSGTPEQLLDRYGISARHIVAAVTTPVGNPGAAMTRRACHRWRRSCAAISAKPEPSDIRSHAGAASAPSPAQVESAGLPQAVDELHLVGAERRHDLGARPPRPG